MGPIGVFDSGYGGLTVLKEIKKVLPDCNFHYLGDNARAPYGDRSFKEVHEFTLQAVKYLFNNDCPLVVLACNTASAKALRNIQQKFILKTKTNKRVLGVLRPSTEEIGNYSKTKSIGILGTKGTIESNSYIIEIKKFFPEVDVYQHACPLWVPLIENGNQNTIQGKNIIKKDLETLFNKNKNIDTVLLACTHYPIIEKIIREHLTKSVRIISQGELVANKLKDYLIRHPELDSKVLKNGSIIFETTECAENFNRQASILLGQRVESKKMKL